jgi:hypothetical protein
MLDFRSKEHQAFKPISPGFASFRKSSHASILATQRLEVGFLQATQPNRASPRVPGRPHSANFVGKFGFSSRQSLESEDHERAGVRPIGSRHELDH